MLLRNLRHPHWKAVDHDIVVEGFENIAREQAMVDARVLVLIELRELILSDIHHDEVGLSRAGSVVVGRVSVLWVIIKSRKSSVGRTGPLACDRNKR
jgi:hypothetical protein